MRYWELSMSEEEHLVIIRAILQPSMRIMMISLGTKKVEYGTGDHQKLLSNEYSLVLIYNYLCIFELYSYRFNINLEWTLIQKNLSTLKIFLNQKLNLLINKIFQLILLLMIAHFQNRMKHLRTLIIWLC